MSKKTPKVLVLDGMWNKTLSAVRSFGESGYRVTVGESTRLATALFSRYAAKAVVYPSPTSRPGEFMDWLLDELRGGSYDMVFPTELSTQLLIGSRRAEIKAHAAFPFAENTATERVHDKAWLMAFAAERGYDTPDTFIPLEGEDIVEDFRKRGGFLNFPVVVKPRASSGSRGIIYVTDDSEIEGALRSVHSLYPYPIVQEYIPSGDVGPGAPGSGGYGVGALMNFDFEPRAAFVYRRVREYPVSGGPSTMRESVEWDELKDTALSLLQELGWTGLAMVEFRVDSRDGRPKLLEINPRPWGSMNLARLSGIDFPCMLHRMATDGDVPARMDYKVGVRSRWLLPGEIMHLLTSTKKWKTLREMLRPSDGDDIISWKDPLPLVGRVFSILPFLYNKEMRSILAARF